MVKQKAYNILLGIAALLLAVTVALTVVTGNTTPATSGALAFVLLLGVPFLVFWFMPGSGVVRVITFAATFIVMDLANVYLFGLSEEMYLAGDGGLWFVIMMGGGGIFWWWQQSHDS